MKNNIITYFVLCIAPLFVMMTDIQANVTLPKILGSHMVLQRESPVKIWGWAESRERVKVIFSGRTYKTRAGRNGKWQVELPAQKAGGPFEITIEGKNKIILEDIYFGDVWVCSGQSNMQWPVSSAINAEEEIAAADFPKIRLFTVPNVVGLRPQEDINRGKWEKCSPETVPEFSAVGFFFGRKLHKHLDIPIGLINTSWGGTNAEAWTSADAISTVEEFNDVEERIQELDPEKMKQDREEFYKNIMREFGETKGGIVNGKAVWADPDVNTETWKTIEVPGLWERRGLPGLDGVVWFRFEFEAPEKIEGKKAMVHLGKIDDSDKTWLNGTLVGETYDKYREPRTYHIPEGILKAGKNVLVVRVEDYQGGGGFWSGPTDMELTSDEFTVGLAGDWKYRISPVDLHVDIAGVRPNELPSSLFNSMIHPLLNYEITGAIWYQGEANASRAYQYRKLFPLMIKNWREKWNDPDMPFLFVQLANFMEADEKPADSEWAELREAQSMALSLPNTGMASAIDIGVADDIHPRNKQEVGRRLALAARKIVYGEDIVHSGPTFKSMSVENGKARIEFTNTGSGLKINNKYGYLMGFAIAGKDKEFHWAKAKLDGNEVIVYSGAVDDPVAVRYAWGNNPDDANLYNKEGLPANPFRTDEWKGITYGKK